MNAVTSDCNGAVLTPEMLEQFKKKVLEQPYHGGGQVIMPVFPVRPRPAIKKARVKK